MKAVLAGRRGEVLSNAIRAILLATLASSGIIALLRAFLGPFRLFVPINSPLNAESVFGLALTMLLAVCSDPMGGAEGNKPQERPETLRPRLGLHLIWASFLVALIIVFFWKSLSFFFLSDDFVLLKQANSFTHKYALQVLTHGGGDGFFRPMGYFSLWANSAFARFDPFRWHASNLFLHVVNSLLVFYIAVRFRAALWAAFMASAVFALHGGRPEAVTWLAGRFDILATLFVLAAILLFERSYESRNWPSLSGSMICMLLAILSKESAYVLPLLLLLVLAVRGDLVLRHALVLFPFCLLEVLMFGYRWRLFGGIGGYVDPQSGSPQVFRIGIGTLKALSLRLWAALYFPFNWSAEPSIWVAILIAIYICSLACLAASRVGRSQVLLALGFIVASTLPVLHLLLIGADLQKSRLLYLPSVGFGLLVAAALQAFPWRFPRPLIAAAVLAFHTAALGHNLNIWGRVSSLAERSCATAAGQLGSPQKRVVVVGLPGSIHGVYFFANGFPECVNMLSPNASRSVEVIRTDRVPEVDSDAVILVWDPANFQFRRTK